MMKYLQRIGKSLMLPVAVLPAAGILYGIGYWIDPTGWGANSVVAAFLIKAASAIIDQIPILFAIGVAVGMAKDHDGTSALAGLVSFLMITTLLSTGAVAMYRGVDVSEVPEAFAKINNAFIGILAGIIGSSCYNRFHKTELPDWLGFFSGKRCVAIVTSLCSIIVALVLYLVWPLIFSAFVAFGTAIIGLGPVGAGIYATLNRALIPLGLHHALNAVFWFDTAGINDLGLFWSGAEGAVKGVTGQYMTGFFPITMFGLPAAALAMYHTAKDSKKKAAGALLFAGALASFFTGITEPFEFAFMFLAPGLYLVHALLTGVSAAVCTLLPFRVGFNFSAGLVDWVLSVKAPMAVHPWMLIPVGLVFGVIYYFLFRFLIVKFNLKTPGREDDEEVEGKIEIGTSDYAAMARVVLEGLGGKENVSEYDYCATRLRVEIKDYTAVDEKKIKSAGVPGVVRPSMNTVQVVVGPKVQFVFDEFKKFMVGDKEVSSPAADDRPAATETAADETTATETAATDTTAAETVKEVEVTPFLSGKLVDITKVPDEVFSKKILGDGVAIDPTDNVLLAPADGVVTVTMPESKHAIGMKLDNGAEILLHVGLDTVGMNGVGFDCHVAEGTKVKRGDQLITFQPEKIREAGHEKITMLVVTDPAEARLSFATEREVEAGTGVMGSITCS